MELQEERNEEKEQTVTKNPDALKHSKEKEGRKSTAKKQKKTASGARNRHSIRFQILGLCLAGIILVVADISILILPKTGSVVKNSITVHMNDFVTEHSKQIDNYISSSEQVLDNIQQTCASAAGVVNTVGIYKQVSRQLKVYDTQNQLGDNYAVIVDENRKVVAATRDEYMDRTIDQDTYNHAMTTEDDMKVTTVNNASAGTVDLILSKLVTLSDGTKAMLYYYTDNSELQRLLLDYTLNDIPDSKVSLVDENGRIIAHSDQKQIGKKTDNTVVLDFCKTMGRGKVSKEAVYGNYTSKGDSIGSSYICLPRVQWVMVVTALDKQVFQDVHNIQLRFGLSCFFSILITSILITLASKGFSKPIQEMNRMIGRIAKLDYTRDEKDIRMRIMKKRKDEIGEIARSIDTMITQVTAKLNEVSNSSVVMNESAVNLHDITGQISEKASDTSAITEEISAGMEETTASTEVITQDIDLLKEHISKIKDQIGESAQFTNEMMQHSEKMIEESMQTEERTKQLFETIRLKGVEATKKADAVKQIDEFAGVIQSIASQTSLLSLNASIEAARAGDAGRGFSVVAQEIGSLASQSSDTVRKISDMVQEVNEAVANILECLNTCQEFVEENVYTDYQNIQNVLRDYGTEMKKIHENMSQVDQGASSVDEKVGSIAESIQAINQTLQESAVGIADIAARNGEIGELTSDSVKMVDDTEGLSKALKESMEEFKL